MLDDGTEVFFNYVKKLDLKYYKREKKKKIEDKVLTKEELKIKNKEFNKKQKELRAKLRKKKEQEELDKKQKDLIKELRKKIK